MANPVFQVKNGGEASSASSVTVSLVTPGSLTNPFILAFVGIYDNASSADRNILSVRFNGVNLYKIDNSTNPAAADAGYDSVWGLQNCPQNGTYNLIVTTQGATTNTSLHGVVVSNVGGVDTYNNQSIASATAHNITITTTKPNCFIASKAGFGNIGGATTTGADQTEIANTNSGFFLSSYSNTIKATPGAVTHTYTTGSADSSGSTLVSLYSNDYKRPFKNVLRPRPFAPGIAR